MANWLERRTRRALAVVTSASRMEFHPIAVGLCGPNPSPCSMPTLASPSPIHLGRQSVLQKPVPHAKIPAELPSPLGLPAPQPRILPGLLSLVQRRAPPLEPRLEPRHVNAYHGALRSDRPGTGTTPDFPRRRLPRPPERFVRKPPARNRPPSAVWINPPIRVSSEKNSH